ncbi:MAG TPA: DUF1320 domain-containing protein [Candidatus Marinimicrobia bacterium]|nr:DUF1320 domain-containing protein [Candidatus Neomarinimicrobiota bacterium]
MGNYIATTALLDERMGAQVVTNLCRDLVGAAKETFLVNTINRAEETANSYLAIKYAIPIPASGWIQEICMTIVEYELYKRGQGDNVPEKYKNSRDESFEYLKDVAEGNSKPPGDPPPSNLTGGSTLVIETDTPLMNEKNLDFF